MKNLKNMISAASLMAVMAMGAISANAGLLISDRSATGATPAVKGCETIKDSATQNADGIIIIGFQAALDGIIIIGRAGLLISDKVAPCADQAKDGILITD